MADRARAPQVTEPAAVVVRSFRRPEPAVVAALGAAGVATLHEAQDRTGLLSCHLRPIYDGASVAAPAVTVLCEPGDNLMIHLAVETCRPGDVLVVALASPSESGFIGELIATSLRAHGVVGAIVDAGVRDVAALRTMGFPVWSRVISAQGTTKHRAGSVNVPVVCAGQLVRPGDVIVADDDGVVCVARSSAERLAVAATERIAAENDVRGRLARGELGADLHGLRAMAAGLGIEHVDDTPAADGM